MVFVIIQTDDAAGLDGALPHDLRLTTERHPLVHFHPLREHAGLSLSSQ